MSLRLSPWTPTMSDNLGWVLFLSARHSALNSIRCPQDSEVVGSITDLTAETRLAGNPPLPCVFSHHFFIRGDIDAVDPIVSYVTVDPLVMSRIFYGTCTEGGWPLPTSPKTKNLTGAAALAFLGVITILGSR